VLEVASHLGISLLNLCNKVCIERAVGRLPDPKKLSMSRLSDCMKKNDVTEFGQPIQLLDVIVVMFESWKIFIILPVLAGILTFFALQPQPRLYGSKSTLFMLSTKDGSRFSQNLIAQALKDVAPSEIDRIGAAIQVRSSLHVFGPLVKNEVLILLEDAKMPEMILRALVTEYNRQFLEPVKEQYISRYNYLLALGESEIKDRLDLRNRLEQSIATKAADSKGPGDASGSTLLSLTTSIEERRRENASLRREMQSMLQTLILDPPSAPVLVQGPRTSAAIIFAMVGTSALTLMFLALQLTVQRQAAAPGGAEKMARLRRALGLKVASTGDGRGK
jgi:hypothetical protein